jgi:hypothetical protein
MDDDRLDGGCLCGAVRYQITAPLGITEHCHCSMCRKAHAAAFSTNAVVPADAFQVTRGERLLSEYASSPNRRKNFCSRCGTQLFIRRLDETAYTVVTLATIDGDPRARPVRHVHATSKAPWYDITDRLPQFATYPGAEAKDRPQ